MKSCLVGNGAVWALPACCRWRAGTAEDILTCGEESNPLDRRVPGTWAMIALAISRRKRESAGIFSHEVGTSMIHVSNRTGDGNLRTV